MRTVELQLVKDAFHSDMISVIPSTYNLCRMYDNKSVQLQITSGDESINLEKYQIYIRFISGNIDVGKFLVRPNVKRLICVTDNLSSSIRDRLECIEESNCAIYVPEDDPSPSPIDPVVTEHKTYYFCELSAMYTRKSELKVQVILENDNGDEIRTNIVKFNLGNSLPLDTEFFQNLSYLDRLVYDNKLVLKVDHEDKELLIFDDLRNKLCSIDIEYMLGGDEVED